MILSTIVFLFALGFADARPRCKEHTAVQCPSGLHIVGVRGTLELPGHGALQDVVDGLKEMYPGSDDYAIDYPAEGVDPPEKPGEQPQFDLIKYQNSAQKGYNALTSHLRNYAEQCEDTKIVLLGYSQGAHVIGDTLCGNQNLVAGHYKRALDFLYTLNIEGVITLGDPANNNKVPWHQGNGSYSGMFKRIDYAGCSTVLHNYGQSWCDDKDFFCEFSHWGFRGSIDVHMRYVSRHKDEILAQTKKQIEDHKEPDDDSKFVWQGIDL